MEPFLAEIKIFAGNFAPKGWAFCDGSLLNISQYSALFALLGITYGGDGKRTFGLPNFQGRAPMHFGQGPGLSNRLLGETGGETGVTLLATQLPMHGHPFNAIGRGIANRTVPASNVALSKTPDGSELYVSTGANVVPMSPAGVGQTGGNGAHNNMQPYLALSFIIALQGQYPLRS